jgi:hypothetical protein
MIPGTIHMEFQPRSFDLPLKPPARSQVCLTKRWTVDAALRRCAYGSQFVKGGKHPVRVDAKILYHCVPSLRKIWWLPRVYLLDILSIVCSGGSTISHACGIAGSTQKGIKWILN